MKNKKTIAKCKREPKDAFGILRDISERIKAKVDSYDIPGGPPDWTDTASAVLRDIVEAIEESLAERNRTAYEKDRMEKRCSGRATLLI